MKHLSYWASRHKSFAILLIIIGEVTNGFNGILLGANLLETLPIAWLHICLIGLISFAFFIQLHAKRLGQPAPYWVVRKWAFAAFLSNFLMFGLLGGIWAHRIEPVSEANHAFGGRRISVVRNSLPSMNSAQVASRSVIKKEDPLPKKSHLIYKYILLGLLGIAIGGFGLGLTCAIACNGYGFLALLVFYLDLGVLAGAGYFFSRAAQLVPKRRRDMTNDERRADTRRFWLPWVILIGITSLIILLTASRR